MNYGTSDQELSKTHALDPYKLLEYAEDTSEEGRYQLANAVIKFFDTRKLSDTEQHLASDIMLSLIRQAELDLREALAERLSVQGNIPEEVIIFLANDEISVARPVLLHSPVLKDIDLMFIIASKGEEYWRSIAERSQLSPMVADRLVDTGDTATVLNLIGNQKVVLQKNTVKKIVRVSLTSEALQEPLLHRPEVDSDLAVDLYMCVSHALRNEIMMRFHVPVSMVESALEALVTELSQEAKGVQRVTHEMRVIAKRFHERDAVTPGLMIKTLRRGQISFFIALFSEKLRLEPDAIVRLSQKDGGMNFALACRSIGMIKSEFASLYLLSRGVGGGNRTINQRELAVALKYFDALREFDVHRIIKKWVKNPELI